MKTQKKRVNWLITVYSLYKTIIQTRLYILHIIVFSLSALLPILCPNV